MALAIVPESETREQPHSAAAERAVLGTLLVTPSALRDIADALAVDDFFQPTHREIFEAALALDRRGRPADVLAVADELKARGQLARLEGGEKYLLALSNESVIQALLPHRIAKVASCASLRRLIAACAEASSCAYGGEEEPEEIADRLGGQLVKLAQSSSRDLAPIKNDLATVLDTIEQREIAQKPVTGVATGIDGLDNLTGGLQPGNQVVIAARPGVGKTAWALNVIRRHALRGCASLVFSIEMTRYELIERLLAMEAPFDSERLRRGQIKPNWDDLRRSERALSDAKIFVVDDQSAMRHMAPTARRFRARFAKDTGDRAPLIVIDYLQLMQIDRGFGRVEGIGEISHAVKRLAKELEVPIVLISQLNRESEKESRPPRLSDLRDSGDIEQDADIVIFPHNPERRDANNKIIGRVEDGEVGAILAKNRNGRTGFVPMHWRGRYYRFDNATAERDPRDEDEYDRRHP